MQQQICRTTPEGHECGYTAIMRVTLNNGAHREAVGCGFCKADTLATAVGHAQKEAVTDALKDALGMLGRGLGLGAGRLPRLKLAKDNSKQRSNN